VFPRCFIRQDETGLLDLIDGQTTFDHVVENLSMMKQQHSTTRLPRALLEELGDKDGT